MDHSEKYIYIPARQDISITLKKILKILSTHHKEISQLSLEEQISKLLSVAELQEILKKDTDLLASEKSNAVIQKALLEMLGLNAEDRKRYGYLYPILTVRRHKIFPKICIIAPQIEHRTEIALFRENCFAYSIKIIDKILENKISKKKENQNRHPVERLYGLVQPKNLGASPIKSFYYNLNGLSFESEMRNLLKKYFHPFNFFPFEDFITDTIHYGLKEKKILFIASEYHIIREEILVDKNGNFIEEPNLYVHFFTHLKALEQFIQYEISEMAKIYSFNGTLNSIEEHKIEFSKIYEDQPQKEFHRIESLLKIIDEIPMSFQLSETDKIKIQKARQAIILIRRIQEQLPEVEFSRKRNYIKLFFKIWEEKIREHCLQKKTLFVIDRESLIKSMTLDITGYYDVFEEAFTELLKDKFGYMESKTRNGNITYHIAYVPIISLLAHNLYILSFSSESYKKPLEICKLIQSRLEIQKSPYTNAELSAEELAKIKRETLILDRRNKIRKRQTKFWHRYNWKIGLASFLFSLLYFILLFVFFKKKLLLYFAIPASLAIGIVLSRVFSRLGLRSEPIELNSDYEHNQIYEEIANIVFSYMKKNTDSIEDRIFYPSNLQERINQILGSIRNLPIPASELKESERNQILLNHYILPRCAIIKIPTEFEAKKLPRAIILIKEDIKTPKIRNELINYFDAKRSNSKAIEKDGTFSYYNYLYNCLEKDFVKFLQ